MTNEDERRLESADQEVDPSPTVGAGFTDDEPFTTEEMLDQAQANAQAAIIATVAFLRDEGIALDRWAASLGRTFARGWDDPRPWDAGEFMDAMLTNFRSLGASITSSALAEDQAEATASGFPDLELCSLFDVPVDEVARFNEATTVLANERGLDWLWQLDGDETRYVARRRET